MLPNARWVNFYSYASGRDSYWGGNRGASLHPSAAQPEASGFLADLTQIGC